MLLEFEVERYVDFVDIILLAPVSSLISISSLSVSNISVSNKTEYKLPIIERKMTQAGTVYNYAHMQLINVLTKALQ